MKKITILAGFLCLFNQLFAQLDYQISPWYHQKKAAVVLTFDDWTPDHYSFVIPELLKRNVTGTFYVNQLRSYESMKMAAKQGIEIGNHTKSHPDLSKKNAYDLKTEIEDFNIFLEAQLKNNTATFAYPFGAGVENTSKGEEIRTILKNHFVAARGVYAIEQASDKALTYDFAQKEDDYYTLKVAPVSDGIQNFMERISWVEKQGGLLVHMYHGTEPGLYDVVPKKNFIEQLDSLTAHQDLWIASLEQAIKYHRERKSATLTQLKAPFQGNNQWILQLKDALSDSIYQQALTIKIALPQGATSVKTIQQGNQAIDFWWDGDKIVFDVIPDKGNIVFELLNCDAPKIDVKALNPTTICEGQEVTVTTISNPDYTYQWLKNGVKIDGKNTAKVVFKEAGIYQVEVAKKDCKLIGHQTITIKTTGICGIPKAKIKIDRNEFYTNQAFSIDNFSTNLLGNETFEWLSTDDISFVKGQGKSNQKERMTFSFAKAGDKKITLLVRGEKGTDTTSVSVKIIQPEKYVYQESFSGALEGLSIGGWNDYQYAAENGLLKVTYFHPRANEWYSWEHEFKSGNAKKEIDFSVSQNTPVVKVRMRATDTVTVAVFLVDKYNTMTAGQMHNTRALLDVTTEFKEYTIDFSNVFFHQWNNQTLDSTHIKKVRFAANFGYQSFPFTNSFGHRVDSAFVGTLEVDWLGIGRDAEFPSMIALPEEACVGKKVFIDYYLAEKDQEFLLSEELKREGNYIWAEKPMKATVQITAGKEKVKASIKFKECSK